MPRNNLPEHSRRRPAVNGPLFSLPALLTIGVAVLVLAGLALLPMMVWQVNPLLWRQLLRLQGALAGFVLGAVVGFLVGRFSGRRRG